MAVLFLFAHCKQIPFELHLICLHNISIFHNNFRHSDLIFEEQDKKVNFKIDNYMIEHEKNGESSLFLVYCVNLVLFK